METKTTRNISGNLNPVWDEWVVFENSTRTQFSVRVYDSDFNADDALSNGFTWSLVSYLYMQTGSTATVEMF